MVKEINIVCCTVYSTFGLVVKMQAFKYTILLQKATLAANRAQTYN